MRNRGNVLCFSILVWMFLFVMVTSAQERTELMLNHSGRYPKKITLEGSMLAIEEIPNREEFRYLILELKNQDGSNMRKEVRREVAGGSAVFDLAGLPANRYDVILYISSDYFAEFPAILWGDDVQIDWSGFEGGFVPYPYFAHNMSVQEKNQMDRQKIEHYTGSTKKIQSDDPKILDLAASITEGLTDEYEKALAVYTWVCNNIYYDFDSYYGKTEYGDQSALGTLETKKGVCLGYSNLLSALLRANKIPTRNAIGFARGLTNKKWPENFNAHTDVNHTWVEAYIGGRWITMDATWDSFNEWRDGTFSRSGGSRGYHYFDISSELLSADHAIQRYWDGHSPKS